MRALNTREVGLVCFFFFSGELQTFKVSMYKELI